MTLRELSDTRNSISTTRWGFCIIVRFAIVTISLSIIAYVVAHFIGKPLESSFLTGVTTLVAIPVGILSLLKGSQGFETSKKVINNDKGTDTDGSENKTIDTVKTDNE